MSDLFEVLSGAARSAWGSADPLLNDPGFESAGRVHDWRNHVPSVLEKRWPELSYETRLAVAIMAEERASAEKWD